MKGFKLAIDRRKKISLLYLLSFIIACCIYSHFSDDIFLTHSETPNDKKVFLDGTDYILLQTFLDLASNCYAKNKQHDSIKIKFQNLLDESKNTISLIDSSCQLNFEQSEILLDHARFLIVQRRYDDAEVHLLKASAMSKNIGEPEQLLMHLYHRSKKWKQLQRLALETTSYAQNFPEAEKYLNIEQHRTSYLKMLEEETKKHPSSKKLLKLSKALFLENQYAQSYHFAKEAQSLQPESPETHFQLGAIYYKLGNDHKAQKAFKTALALDPNLQTFQKIRYSIQNLTKLPMAFHKPRNNGEFSPFERF